MTIGKAWPFQQAIHTAITAALPGLPGFSYVPGTPPDRYWRIDGFTVSPEQAFKNKEKAQHGFTLNLFDSPNEGTNSLKWVKETMATAHAAVIGLKMDDRSAGIICQGGDTRLEPRDDNVNDARAFLRYTSDITGD